MDFVNDHDACRGGRVTLLTKALETAREIDANLDRVAINRVLP